MYSGTSEFVPTFPKTPGNAGAAYVTRTRDPIITNKGYPRQTAVFLPTSVLVWPICSDFVRVFQRSYVHMYIGPKADGNPLPALTTNAKGARNG